MTSAAVVGSVEGTDGLVVLVPAAASLDSVYLVGLAERVGLPAHTAVAGTRVHLGAAVAGIAWHG